MPRLTLNLDMGNAAFFDESSNNPTDTVNDYARGVETARILRALAADFSENGLPADGHYSLRDVNGNTCGTAIVQDFTTPDCPRCGCVADGKCLCPDSDASPSLDELESDLSTALREGTPGEVVDAQRAPERWHDEHDDDSEPAYTPSMTFAQFMATAQHVDDIAAACPGAGDYLENDDGSPRVSAGVVFAGDAWIERNPEPALCGRWHLIIERSEWNSSDLESLARILYQWCVDEQCI